MPAFLRTGPSVEPISLAEATAQLRLEETSENDAVASLISAARVHVERFYGLALISQAWTLRLDDWPRNPEIALPVWPVAAIEAVKVIGEEGAAFLIDEAHYVADLGARPARLVRRPDRHWPRPGRLAGGIEIDFTAGFGPTADDVPQPIRHALKLFIGLLYEDRQALATMAEPPALAALLSPYRDCRL